MFEARHTMDAPTTASADNGTSGGGGGGWFTPRQQPATTPDSEREAAEGSRRAAMRPTGRTSADTDGDQTAQDARQSPPPVQPASAASASPPPHPPSAARPQATDPSVPQPLSADLLVPAQRSTAPAAQPHEPSAQVRAESASPDALLIRRTMTEVAPIADKVTSYFYALLFVRHPDLRSLFPAAMDTQRDRLLRALLTAAEHIDNTDVLVAYLQNLGRGHRKYGTRAEHYPAVGECLIGALSKYAAGIWDAEMEAAWVRAYTTISQVMIDAAAADELRSPAWWYAEIVAHELRTPDVAVVTVRPDQPYPFLAGQYTSLETPWWPRIWRHYSFASAPRSDGLLTFHVKAVPAGWVSNALVHRARPGDIIRLGPPTGSMTVDHTTDSGLLCLGGGTGIAPIKALVEDVAEHGERRPVEVFYGARTDHDLYDIDTMLRLQQSHPWLSVRAVIDQQAQLQLPDAIREYGPWNEFDAYLSGPPGMIRSGVDALRNIGIPSERIRHDSVEELVTTGD
ncbi:globin domain-containing protein [Streptomyces guryensis]|uniref:nitric oxide dioxygenase n=1 Tax=Streptomyces guryensis TaxID=2886947 RepID=A0A9Q3VTH2_9ACTN|nr:globin domain-containing protein [Streptomyces guryensis]MCD9877011.1 FAD-binding oxidoreductase [Streptomyces guryensis]